MIRRLLILFGLLLTWLVARRIFRSAPSASRPAQPRFEGAMVRDRVCETFLPRSRALTAFRDGQEHFFCSESCRSRFLSSGLEAPRTS